MKSIRIAAVFFAWQARQPKLCPRRQLRPTPRQIPIAPSNAGAKCPRAASGAPPPASTSTATAAVSGSRNAVARRDRCTLVAGLRCSAAAGVDRWRRHRCDRGRRPPVSCEGLRGLPQHRSVRRASRTGPDMDRRAVDARRGHRAYLKRRTEYAGIRRDVVVVRTRCPGCIPPLTQAQCHDGRATSRLITPQSNIKAGLLTWLLIGAKADIME